MDLLAFVNWVEASAVGTWVRETSWAFAVIESIHLLALSVIGGAILIVDLRLLGLGLKQHTVSDLGRDAHRWQNISYAIMLVTGVGLFSSEALKCYYSSPFWFKIITLAMATVFTYTVRRKVVFAPEGRFSPAVAGMVAVVSMTLWLCVGAGGRWIGFSG
jgi:hypothetical protein